jgi:CTP:molybdopterin cytidylyltransferase MocA
MGRVTVLIFHRPASAGEPELVRLLASVRDELAAKHAAAFREAGAGEVRFVYEWHEDLAFGEVLAKLAPARGGVIVLSGGAVPLLNRRDAMRLVEAAGADEPRALTNNRYSSDVCAVAQAQSVRKLPPLPTDNALPRWLEEHAGYSVTELRARERLGLDLDTPQDVALAALAPTAPAWLSQAARAADLAVPRMDELRALAQDPHAELLVFGRSGSATLRWLERSVRCRVRFLAEERGLRASTPRIRPCKRHREDATRNARSPARSARSGGAGADSGRAGGWSHHRQSGAPGASPGRRRGELARPGGPLCQRSPSGR